jgi:hypothetical protein
VTEVLGRLDPSDEFMHPGSESNFNESMYVNAFDAAGGAAGGWFRIGNRPNEGYAEVTVCVYLPDGSVGFMFSRPHIDSNERFDAGGMRFEIVEPFKKLDVSHRGMVALLADPLVMKDPARAFAESPQVPCEVDLTFSGLSPVWGGEPQRGESDSTTMPMEFARGHYEQHVGARGRIAVGDQTWEMNGFGLRDHSWGPRWWQAPAWYRWLTGNAGPEAGFMVSVIARRDGSVRRTGVVFENGAYTPISAVQLHTDWAGEDRYQRAIRCIASTPTREVKITGTVHSLIPLRNRRGDAVTRISEGFTEWTWEGRTGYGMAEYLDQMVDGRPAGD